MSDNAGESATDTGVTYEVEVEAAAASPDTSQAGGGQGEPSSPAAAPAGPPEYVSRAEYNELLRQHAQTVGDLQPLLSHLNRQQAQANRPPVTPEQLDLDPNMTPAHLRQYTDYQIQQQVAQAKFALEANTQAVLSQERARGEFSIAAMGEGHDFDSMTAKYVAPLLQKNPYVEEAIRLAAPGDPAKGRMVLAVMAKVIADHNEDLPKALRAILDSKDAYQRGSKATTTAITDAANRQADRVFGKGAPSAQTKKLDAKGLWNLPDAEFRKLMARNAA